MDSRAYRHRWRTHLYRTGRQYGSKNYLGIQDLSAAIGQLYRNQCAVLRAYQHHDHSS